MQLKSVKRSLRLLRLLAWVLTVGIPVGVFAMDAVMPNADLVLVFVVAVAALISSFGFGHVMYKFHRILPLLGLYITALCLFVLPLCFSGIKSGQDAIFGCLAVSGIGAAMMGRITAKRIEYADSWFNQ